MIFTSTYSGPTYQPDDNDRLARLGAAAKAAPGFSESLALETFQSMTEAEFKFRMDSREYALQVEGELRQEMFWFEMSEVSYFQALNAYHDQNMEIVYLTEHWKPEERAKIISQGLLPYSMPKIHKYAMTMLGEMMGQETELRTHARTTDEEPFAEAMNTLLRYFDRESRWDSHKNYVRRDALIGSRGVAGCRKDPANMMGGVKKSRYRPHELMWHTRTAINTIDETKYMERIYYDYRANVMMEFPEFAEEIRDFTPQAYGMQAAHIAQLDVMIKPRIQPPSGTVEPVYVHDPYVYYMWRDAVLRREFFRKHPLTQFRVVDPYRSKFYDADTKQQAWEWGKKCYQYWQNMFAAQGINDEPQISDPEIVTKDQIERCTVIGNIVVRVEPIGEAFPYDVLATEFLDGSVTSPFGHAKDPVRIADRMTMRLDQFGGASKGKRVVNLSALQGIEMDDVDLKRNLASDEPLLVRIPLGMGRISDIMENVAPPALGPIADVMKKNADEALDEFLGGENFIGQQQSSAESGRAVMARQTAASLGLIPFEKETEAWEEHLGRKEVQIIQSLDPIVIRAILRNEDPAVCDALMQAMAASGVESLAEIDMRLELVETQASPSTKDRILSQIQYIMGQSPALAAAWSDMATEYMDIDDSIRKKVEAKMQAQQQHDNMLAERQQAHTEYIERTELDLKHMDRMIRLKEMEIEANPPWQKTMSVKLPQTPAMLATAASTAGMEADARGVAQDLSFGALLRQGERDMQQQHRNENLLPEEIEGLENKAKQPYRNPTPTVENSTARDDKTVSKD